MTSTDTTTDDQVDQEIIWQLEAFDPDAWCPCLKCRAWREAMMNGE